MSIQINDCEKIKELNLSLEAMIRKNSLLEK